MFCIRRPRLPLLKKIVVEVVGAYSCYTVFPVLTSRVLQNTLIHVRRHPSGITRHLGIRVQPLVRISQRGSWRCDMWRVTLQPLMPASVRVPVQVPTAPLPVLGDRPGEQWRMTKHLGLCCPCGRFGPARPQLWLSGAGTGNWRISLFLGRGLGVWLE